MVDCSLSLDCRQPRPTYKTASVVLDAAVPYKCSSFEVEIGSVMSVGNTVEKAVETIKESLFL